MAVPREIAHFNTLVAQALGPMPHTLLRNVVGRTSRSGCPLGRVLQDPPFAQRNRRVENLLPVKAVRHEVPAVGEEVTCTW
jgi:hypothetical protein